MQYAKKLTSTWPPQPTTSWAGVKIYKLSQIQQALSTLDKPFRKPPDISSKLKTPKLVKANKKFLEEQHSEEGSELTDPNDYCRKLGLTSTNHNNKIARGLAKFVREQLGLELVEVSKSDIISIDLFRFLPKKKNPSKSIELNFISNCIN